MVGSQRGRSGRTGSGDGVSSNKGRNFKRASVSSSRRRSAVTVEHEHMAKKVEYTTKIIETLVAAGRRVSMGYGIHYGWAIEGAIGSHLKIDASYLSPHVNTAARLEAATKQFGVMFLLSGEFVRQLSPPNRRLVRQIDSVVLVGKSTPTSLYCWDMWLGPSEKQGVRAHRLSPLSVLNKASQPKTKNTFRLGSKCLSGVVEGDSDELQEDDDDDDDDKKSPSVSSSAWASTEGPVSKSAPGPGGGSSGGGGRSPGSPRGGPPPIRAPNDTPPSAGESSRGRSNKGSGSGGRKLHHNRGRQNIGPRFQKPVFDPRAYCALFSSAYKCYAEGDWSKAESRLRRCLKEVPNDGPALSLRRAMAKHQYEAPSGWLGYRSLTEK